MVYKIPVEITHSPFEGHTAGVKVRFRPDALPDVDIDSYTDKDSRNHARLCRQATDARSVKARKPYN